MTSAADHCGARFSGHRCSSAGSRAGSARGIIPSATCGGWDDTASRFGARYHPILHMWRAHEGVDFSAAYGTPVRATADGIVARVGREDGGYGNLIEVRHPNGIRTRYGHLSSFARGLRPGERVAQGETIGYVGSTGLSTGPHLHYEFLENGRPTNPRGKDMGAGTPVPRRLAAAFDTARDGLRILLEPQTSPLPTARPITAARD